MIQAATNTAGKVRISDDRGWDSNWTLSKNTSEALPHCRQSAQGHQLVADVDGFDDAVGFDAIRGTKPCADPEGGMGKVVRKAQGRRIGREFSSRMRKEMVVQSTLFMESRVDRRGPGKAAWSARMERGD